MTIIKQQIFLRATLIFILLAVICLSLPGHAGNDQELIRAVESNNAYQTQNLLAKGANPDARNSQGYTALMLAARNEQPKLAALLLEAGANPNLRNKYGETAVMLASYHGQVDLVKQLYAKGAEIDHDGWNPLIYAASKGYNQIVEYLLGVGVRVNAKTDNGTTALMMAARGNHYGTVELLLSHGADALLSNDANGTALKWAEKHGHRSVVKLLKHNGATK